MSWTSIENIDKLNGIGKEPNIGGEHKGNNERRKRARRYVLRRYRNWLIGLVISLIPLLAVPFMHLFEGESTFPAMCHEVFESQEIIFVGIALSIAALNDFIAQRTLESREGWTWSNIIIITFGAMIYGGLAVENSAGKSLSETTIFAFNLIYLGIVFLLGTAKYLSEILEVK